MSVNVQKRVEEPGEAEYAERVWTLKERIRKEEDVLKQRRGFFMNAYRRSRSHLLFRDDELVGFVTARRDGYVLFLAVAPEARGEGLGRRLIAEVASDHETVTCHARTTNQRALEFYERIGFDIVRRIDGYYEDGGDAYYLKLGEEESLRGKISEFIRR